MTSQVTFVRGCLLPLDLYYKIEEHLWLRVNDDKSITLGFTDVAQTTAGRILIVSFRPVNAYYQRGKTIAIVESAKWLGPVRAPMNGALVAVNEMLLSDARPINHPHHLSERYPNGATPGGTRPPRCVRNPSSLATARGREMAKALNVLSVPTVFVNGTRFVGVPVWNELLAAVNREKAALSSEYSPF